ncbi:hypothetical protein P691DRAFT_723388 [Macrolepiota fuliginosa MF-IS2]|uniref:Uncharacterized protein n=1 Tax=Macrolepiota fuliginosa MF-IS2 TaxID=1400762 RepID=A0A9P5XJ26_9AGAR|nr:hypothetical protein P691DRAFT_723388 [Macrolepiota fuliginosa MF-IS2]
MIPIEPFPPGIKNINTSPLNAERLAKSLAIPDKNYRAQFKEPIVDPFHYIVTRHSPTVQEPMLIISGGLDECKDEEAQCGFIEPTSNYVRLINRLWIICNCPNWHPSGPRYQIQTFAFLTTVKSLSLMYW